MTRRAPFDRISSEDLMSLVGDTGSAPMQVGAVLTLRTGPDPDAHALFDTLAHRLHAVPRLRQRLLKVPLGCGRPVWVNDSGFDPARHLSVALCRPPGGQEAVLQIAAEMLTTPLPHDRPLWTAKLVTDTAPNQVALVFVFHHVLTDGIGGLAILAALAAAKASTQDGRGEAHPLPSRLPLALDAAGERIRGLKRLPTAVRRLAAARTELRPSGGVRPAPSSLNRPTGPRRQVAVVRADLEGIRATARVQGATVNDAVLTAAAASLHRLLQERGESVEQFVISVPFSSRRHADAGELGNRSGVIPVTVPAVGDRVRRLAAVAAITTAAKKNPPGASTALLGPLFRLLARVGVYRTFIDHQRMVHTFVTNVRGPEHPLTLCGWPVTGMIPLGAVTGNVTVAFAVLSYAGTLVVSLIADPDTCPDLGKLRDGLENEFRAMTRHPPDPGGQAAES